MHRIPYELLESLFGTWFADNFNSISAFLCIAGIILYTFGGNRRR